MLDKWCPLRHLTHIMPNVTKLLMAMKHMTKLKTKSHMNGQNENFKM